MSHGKPSNRPRPAAGRSAALVAAIVLGGWACGCLPATVTAAEADRIAEVLAVRPGANVADVGAGDGEWSEDLARRVGPLGHVWATEVDEDELRDIERRMEHSRLTNVSVVSGEATDTGLPDGCCDAVLLRLVYHHLTDPAPMRESLARALRQGGLLAVIEIRPQRWWPGVRGVPDRGGHGISPEDLIDELTADGWEVVSRHDEWPGDSDSFCVVFTH